MEAPRRASIRDVARLADVSRQTVSRVINTPDAVAPVTRRRVEDAIRALDYRPDPNARGLRSAHTRTIGVLANAESWFGLMGAPTITRAARSRGYTLLFAGVFDDSFEEARSAAAHLLDQKVEGLLVMAPRTLMAEYAAHLAGRLPVVVVQGEAPTGAPVTQLAIDTRAGMGLVVDHLAGLGHRDLAHISGPLTWQSARARVAAWREATERRGLPFRLAVEGTYRPEGGYAAGVLMLERGLPGAVFAGNDLSAMGFVRAMVDHGVRVPQDVSVVGYDDLAEARYLVPRLTTVRQPFDELCDRAVAVLGEAIAGSEVRDELLQPQLMVRESTAAPRE